MARRSLTAYRVKNWPGYDQALYDRANITLMD